MSKVTRIGDDGFSNTNSIVKINDDVLGNVWVSDRDRGEYDVWLNVTSEKQFASDVNVSFSQNSHTFVFNLDATPSIGRYDYRWARNAVPRTDYLVTNSELLAIPMTDVNDVLENQDAANINKLYTDTTYNAYGITESLKNTATTKGVIKVTGSLGKDSFSNLSWSTKITARIMYPIIDANGNMTNNIPSVDLAQFGNTKITVDNISSNDMLKQTPVDTIWLNKNADGSFYLSYNVDFNNHKLNDNEIRDLVDRSYLANVQDPDHHDEIVQNTINYYHGRNNLPMVYETFNGFLKKDNTKPMMISVVNLTPGSSQTATIPYAPNGSHIDGEIYKLASVKYIDDDQNENIVSNDSIMGIRNKATAYSLTVPTGYELSSAQPGSSFYKWSDDKKTIAYTFAEDQKQNDSNPIVIHLTHGRKDLVDSNVVAETVHYQFEDGTKAADDYVAKHVVSSRIGHKDLVTGETVWDSDWSTETFPEVTSPHINGYTANQLKIDSQTVDGTSQDIVKTVVYTANDQKIFVHYIDDTNDTDLHTDPLVGKSNTAANYTTGDTIKNYLNQGYDLVSDDTQGNALKYDADDDHDQIYNVHLKHHISDVTDPKLLNATFDRVITENLPDSTSKQITQHYVISRTGTQDQVTKKYTFTNWSTAQVHEDKGDRLSGYTAVITSQSPEEIAEIVDGTPVVKAETFTNSNDVIQPVNTTEAVVIDYTANDQKIFIHYVDDTNGTDLHNDSLIGKTNTDSNYTTGDAIRSYLNQGYDLVSDDTQGKALKYDADDDHDQVYNVHLKHHISDVTDPKLLNATFDRIITEKLPDDKQRQITQHYVISRTGTQDQVTKKYTFTNWSTAQVHEDKGDKLNGYTAVIASQDPSEIAKIVDGIPVIKAEVFTNSNDVIQPVDTSENVVITYTANDQKIFVHYVDDTNGTDLHTDPLVGKTNTDANYNTVATIKSYLDQGYDLVSDDTQGKALKYDADDEHDQVYNVHLKHHISDVTDPKLLNATFDRIVTEKLPDGQSKQFKQHYVINRTGKQDQVTKKYTFGNWSIAQVHEDKGDNLDGYTAIITNQNLDNIAEIKDGIPVVKAEVFTNANDNSIQPVNINEIVEIAYNANDQKAIITFIDDDAQKDKQVLQTQNLVGKSNTKSNYDTGADVENYLSKGFELVSDDTKGNPITFDAHDKVDQSFEVHLKHHISDVTDPRILNATFDRVITEHTPDGKDKQFKQHYVITRTGTQDQVTKQYKFSDWTVADVHEDKLDNFRGYTAHINSAKPEDFITVVDGIPTLAKAEQFTNENGKLLPKNVSELADISYTANPQSAAIIYIDDTADKVLSKVMTTGHYGEAIEFTPNVSSIIDDLVKKGYVLVSNDFDGQKYDADNNQNIFDVHLKHGTLDVTRSKDVTETIHYVYDNNSKAHDDYVATKKFENHGVKDLVTGETKWDTNWTPESDQFAQVNSPEIPGYTADKTSIPAQTVNADSKNLEYTVTYMQIPAPTPYEPSDPAQPTQPDVQPSTPIVTDQPSVPNTDQQSDDNNAPKRVKHHTESKDLDTDSNVDYGNTVNKSNDYTGIKTVKITQSGKPVRVIKINHETVDPIRATVRVKSQLPKTGNDKDQALVALGLASASLSGLFGLGLRKKRKKTKMTLFLLINRLNI